MRLLLEVWSPFLLRGLCHWRDHRWSVRRRGLFEGDAWLGSVNYKFVFLSPALVLPFVLLLLLSLFFSSPQPTFSPFSLSIPHPALFTGFNSLRNCPVQAAPFYLCLAATQDTWIVHSRIPSQKKPQLLCVIFGEYFCPSTGKWLTGNDLWNSSQETYGV